MVKAGFTDDYDGYEEFGGMGPLSEMANATRAAWQADGTVPDDLKLLRGSLFFEFRRWRHFGTEPDAAAERYHKALVNKMRELVGE